MTKKINIRSIRFSDDVLAIIEAQPGDNFTAKFEYLVRKCHQELPEQERMLKFFKQRSKEEAQRIEGTRALINQVQNTARRMQSSIENWNTQLDGAAKFLEKMQDSNTD